MPLMSRCLLAVFAPAALALGVIVSAPFALAEENAGEADKKAGYHLFRPTPPSLMRDLSTDRPDITESPYSVDAGHFQLEIDVASYSRDEDSARTLENIGLLDINAKLGLLPNLDLQVGAGTARLETTSTIPGEPSEKASGVTDLVVRLKLNLWGNDSGQTALALMPFITLPTGSSDFTSGVTEGGLIVPFAVSLPGDTGLGLMVEADWLQDSDGEGFHTEWLTTATVGRSLVGPIGAFVEFTAGQRPKVEGAWVGTVDVGVTYGPTANVQLDAGVLLGISEEADVATFFAGISLRR